MNKDPNGVAALVTALVIAVAGIFNWQVDDDTASNIGTAVGALVVLAALVFARMKAWAPDTVAKLTPDTVGEAGELPEVPE